MQRLDVVTVQPQRGILLHHAAHDWHLPINQQPRLASALMISQVGTVASSRKAWQRPGRGTEGQRRPVIEIKLGNDLNGEGHRQSMRPTGSLSPSTSLICSYRRFCSSGYKARRPNVKAKECALVCGQIWTSQLERQDIVEPLSPHDRRSRK